MKSLTKKLGVLGMATAGAIALGGYAKAGIEVRKGEDVFKQVEVFEDIPYSPELIEKVCRIAKANPYDSHEYKGFGQKKVSYAFPVQEKQERRHVDFDCTITNGRVSSFHFNLSPEKNESGKGYVPGKFGFEISDYESVGNFDSRDFFKYVVVEGDGTTSYESVKRGSEISEHGRRGMENMVSGYLNDFLRIRPDLTEEGAKMREEFGSDAKVLKEYYRELKKLLDNCNKLGRCWEEI
jgi:hypothetical protein